MLKLTRANYHSNNYGAVASPEKGHNMNIKIFTDVFSKTHLKNVGESMEYIEYDRIHYFSNLICMDKTLTLEEIRLLLFMVINTKRKYSIFHISQRDLENILGISEGHIRKAQYELVEKGYIVQIKKARANKPSIFRVATKYMTK